MRIFLFPCFNLAGFVISDKRAPVFNQLVSDPVGPHQSQPKADQPLAEPSSGPRLWELSSTASDLPPLAILIAPENYRYHAASKVNWITDPLALPVRGPTLLPKHNVVRPRWLTRVALCLFHWTIPLGVNYYGAGDEF